MAGPVFGALPSFTSYSLSLKGIVLAHYFQKLTNSSQTLCFSVFTGYKLHYSQSFQKTM